MDPEINAMSDLATALEPLDEQARRRVLRWADDRYGVQGGHASSPATPKVVNASELAGEEAGVSATESTQDFESIADLFVAANPQTGPEKVLVAAYWFQVLQGRTQLTSFQLNKELKHLGHGVNTINREFDRLMEQKPQLAMQLKKSGSSKQARKTYKLTKAGVDKVLEMVATHSTN